MLQVLTSTTLVTCVMGLPVPDGPAPRVIGVDDFSRRRGHRFATVVTDAVTGRRWDVLPDRRGGTLADWWRGHPEGEVVCRDVAASYAQAITEALPQAVQVSDRWHLWHGLAAVGEKAVAAHAVCWRATAPPVVAGSRNAQVQQLHAAVHDLLEAGVGLMACARRLGLSLNTVKRYARVP